MSAIPISAAWWFGAIMTFRDFGAAIGGAAMVIWLLLGVAVLGSVFPRTR